MNGQETYYHNHSSEEADVVGRPSCGAFRSHAKWRTFLVFIAVSVTVTKASHCESSPLTLHSGLNSHGGFDSIMCLQSLSASEMTVKTASGTLHTGGTNYKDDGKNNNILFELWLLFI